MVGFTNEKLFQKISKNIAKIVFAMLLITIQNTKNLHVIKQYKLLPITTPYQAELSLLRGNHYNSYILLCFLIFLSIKQ